jgi:hypothetical protein
LLASVASVIEVKTSEKRGADGAICNLQRSALHVFGVQP